MDTFTTSICSTAPSEAFRRSGIPLDDRDDAARLVDARESSITPGRRAILHGCIAVSVAFLIEGLFEHNLGDSEVLSMFWIVTTPGATGHGRDEHDSRSGGRFRRARVG